MREHYKDIISRIADPILWFDENGVPRYEAFTPRMCADIYASEAVLLRIECQSCEREFDVCVSWSSFDRVRNVPPLGNQICDHSIHYGDPPNVECCPAGPTMNSIPRRVLQYWRHDDRRQWAREPSFERDIKPEWMED